MKDINTTLKIQLKDNSNISFEVTPQFCECKRPMFLKQSHNGDVFWSCKGFHKDRNNAVCDLTKDVKCFKCHNGEIKRKTNKSTGENFYGCSNYSDVSESSCNFKLQALDMTDVIHQVNEALKYKYDFKTTSHNQNDERKWEKYKLTSQSTAQKKKITNIETKDSVWIRIIKLILNKDKKKSCESSSSEKTSSKNLLKINPKLAGYTATLILAVGLFASMNGMNVEISLFGDLFHMNITPNASPENVDVQINEQNETIVIKNTENKPIDISNLALNTKEGLPIINFASLSESQRILEPNEKLILNKEILLSLINDDYQEEYTNANHSGSLFDSNRDLSDKPGSSDDDIYEAEKYQLLDKLWDGEKVEFVAEVIEKGIVQYEEIKQRIDDKKELLKDQGREYIRVHLNEEEINIKNQILEKERLIREIEENQDLNNFEKEREIRIIEKEWEER